MPEATNMGVYYDLLKQGRSNRGRVTARHLSSLIYSGIGKESIAMSLAT